MVRESGKRGYEDDKHGRSGALVELIADRAGKEIKDSWGELPFYDETPEDQHSLIFPEFTKYSLLC